MQLERFAVVLKKDNLATLNIRCCALHPSEVATKLPFDFDTSNGLKLCLLYHKQHGLRRPQFQGIIGLRPWDTWCYLHVGFSNVDGLTNQACVLVNHSQGLSIS